MDNERARIILSAYRADGADASDSLFAEALEQAERDPSLGRWFAEECALDERMHASLRSVRPPADLKETLLVAEKVSHMPERARWPHRAWLAAAAAIMLLAGLAFFASRSEAPPFTVAAVTSEMVRLKREQRLSLGVMTSDGEQVRRWLNEQDAPDDFMVPARLATQAQLGCQVLDIQGHKVSLICFQVGNGRMVHLLVMDRQHLTDAPAEGKPVLLNEGELAFATWSEGDRTYVIAGRGPAESLRQWL